MPEPRLEKWKRWGERVKRETSALYLACRHPRTPWIARALAACIVAYASSPIDLIPDPVPVLGYLDDLVLVPLGVILVRRLIPAEILEECRQQADERNTGHHCASRVAAAVIVAIWLTVGLIIARLVWRLCAR